MRVSRRAAATVLVVAVSSFMAACAPSTPPGHSKAVRGLTAGATWLAAQYRPSGFIDSPFAPGQPDYSDSAYAIEALHLAKVAPATVATATTALAANVDAAVEDFGGADQAGPLARLILVAAATGHDPHSFGGVDLVARLEATMQTSGPDAGLFGSQDATYDGAFRQGLALAALSVVTPTPEAIDPGAGSITALPAVQWLLDQQCADGSWMEHRSDLGTACAFDPNTSTGPDTNGTAYAAMGLKALGVTATHDVHSWFTSVRGSDHGWSYFGDTTSPSEADSTGLVIAAERALGHDPDAAALTELLSFQLGSSAGAGAGAFFYTGSTTPNLFATEDAALGLSSGVWPQSLTTSG